MKTIYVGREGVDRMRWYVEGDDEILPHYQIANEEITKVANEILQKDLDGVLLDDEHRSLIKEMRDLLQ